MDPWEAKEHRAPQRASLVRNVLAFRDQLDPWLPFPMSKLMSALRVGVCDERRWQCGRVWLKAAVSKTAGPTGPGGSNPSPSASYRFW